MINEKHLKILLKLSCKALAKKEVPMAAIIINKAGKIISTATNSRTKSHLIFAHAEINAIIKANKKIKDWRLNGYTMITTLEPCEMCNIIIHESRLDKVIYLLNKNSRQNQYKKTKIEHINQQNYQNNNLKFEVLQEYIIKNQKKVLSFFNNKR